MLGVMPKSPSAAAKPKPTVSPIASAPAGQPTPDELHQFLVQNLGMKDCIDPQKPAPWWPTLDLTAKPFTDELVRELRGHNRAYLRTVKLATDSEHIYQERQQYLKGSPQGEAPTSEALLQAVGAHVEPGQRLDVCLRMAGITQSDAAVAMNVDDDSGYKALNKYLNLASPNYVYLGKLCTLLDVNEFWIEQGPKANCLSADPIHPWWLAPWWQLREEATRCFELAEHQGFLPLRQGVSPPAYDFHGFWERWQADPTKISIEGLWKADSVFRVLPWLFTACPTFRSGNPTYNVTCTPETWGILQRLVSCYVFDCLPLMAQSTETNVSRPLSAVRPPTLSEIMALQSWMSAPPVENRVLRAANGGQIPLLPIQVTAPKGQLGNSGKPKRGRPPKEDKKV
jgi:hypothetical protein